MSGHADIQKRAYCECGNKATVRLGNAMQCQRCAELSGEPVLFFSGVQDRNPEHVGWLDVKAACLGFWMERGYMPEEGRF